MRRVTKSKEDEDREIAELRKKLGLPPIRTGKRKCLRCEDIFVSEDLVNQFNCKLCRHEDVINVPRLKERD